MKTQLYSVISESLKLALYLLYCLNTVTYFFVCLVFGQTLVSLTNIHAF